MNMENKPIIDIIIPAFNEENAVGNVVIDPALLGHEVPSELIFLPEAGARFPGLVGQTIVLGVVIASLIGLDQAQETLGDMAPTYFVAVAGIVAAFFGTQAMGKKK